MGESRILYDRRRVLVLLKYLACTAMAKDIALFRDRHDGFCGKNLILRLTPVTLS